MACNPMSERQVMVLTSDGRLSFVEVDVIHNNNDEHGLMAVTDRIPRPNICLEDMMLGRSNDI